MKCSCNLCRFNGTLSMLMKKLYDEYGDDEFVKTDFRKNLAQIRQTRTDAQMTERYWRAAQKNECIVLKNRDSAILSRRVIESQGIIIIEPSHRHLSHLCPLCSRNFSSDSMVKKHLVNIHNLSDFHAAYLLNMIR